jgi:hypothetical protein
LFVTRYAYHHRFFDGVEREFRGFGMVEQWDMEEFTALNQSSKFPHSVNINTASQIPPALTKTWTYFEEGKIKGVFNAEYYRESGLSDEMYHVMLLDNTIFPHTIRLEDEHSVPYALTLD